MSYVLILENQKCLKKSHCCQEMTNQVDLGCTKEILPSDVREFPTDKRIFWSPLFDEYGLINSPSFEICLISYCPFCGNKLPKPKRDKWFNKLESLGWKSWEDEVPSKMMENDWDNFN